MSRPKTQTVRMWLKWAKTAPTMEALELLNKFSNSHRYSVSKPYKIYMKILSERRDEFNLCLQLMQVVPGQKFWGVWCDLQAVLRGAKG